MRPSVMRPRLCRLRPRSPRFWALSGALAFLAALGLGGASGCRKPELPPRAPEAPSLRLYVMSTVAGAMEPCGCRMDMLGGIDHAAALLAADAPSAANRLLLAVGPLFFQEPQLDAERREQDLWKAQTIAASLAELRLAAWAPGQNDLAAGPAALGELVQQSGARVLGAGTDIGSARAATTAVFEVGDYKVGVAGVGPGVGDTEAATRALTEASAALAAEGAEIRVALLAAPRGEALRLAEKVPGFDVVALGKPVESGDANDAPFPPVLVGSTLVVQAPNHLQALSYVDLFIRADDFSFEDGVGIDARERRESAAGRVHDLEARLARARASQVAAQISSVESELARAKAELATLERSSAAPPKTDGSIFRYDDVLVRESAGAAPDVAKRMTEYYRKVNDHNRVALADRLPEAVGMNEPRYVGFMACTTCHSPAVRFWKGTQHAQAYGSLSRDFKEFNLDCVGCHVTGYERRGGSTVTHVGGLENVQCESCHGPGSRHAESGGDTAFITLRPDQSVCRGCHHAPHVADDWDLLASWSHIIGEGHGADSKN